jgi:ABC-type amino acid transport substrate-binding protein
LLLALVLGGCAKPAESKNFVVGLDCAYAPYNWTPRMTQTARLQSTAAAGMPAAYDIEMAKLIAEGLAKPGVKKIEWNGLVTACQSGVIDAIIAGIVAYGR